MTNDQIAAVAKTLVDAAQQKNINLRVFAGVAVHMVCPNITAHPKLQRTFRDLDVAAPRADWPALEGIFATNGIKLKTKGEASWIFDKDSCEVELCDPNLGYGNLSARLALATPTLPLADLLLHKLQSKFEEKDIQDSIALLLDHRVATGQTEDQIDQTYISKLCASNWWLFHAVYDNTVTLEQVLDRYVESEEAQLVWRRIEQIQGELDQQPKSFGWMIQQFVRKPTQVPR